MAFPVSRPRRSSRDKSIVRSPSIQGTFTAVFEKAGDAYIGYVEELSGANTQGKTLAEVRENLREAIELILLANRELARKGRPGKGVIREKIRVAI